MSNLSARRNGWISRFLVLCLTAVLLLNLSSTFSAKPAQAATLWTITAKANNDFVSADNYGNNPLIANRTTASGWEQFQIVNNADGTISFLAQVNNLYVTADLNNGGKLIARAATIQQWEEFKKVAQPDGSTALLAMANNQYVSTDLNTGAPTLIADRAAVGGAWEAYVLTQVGSTGGGGTTGPGGSNLPAHVFAPYTYSWDSPPVNMASLASSQGIKYFTLAFILGNGCSAAWNGNTSLSSSPLGSAITNLRAAGGDVIVSFGGADGTYLEDACTSVSSLAAQYQAVINQYNLTYIDFDIENDFGNSASYDRRSQAIAQVQANARNAGKNLKVSFTLGVGPSGLGGDQINVLNSAVANGVNVGLVNIMAMDYGSADSHMGSDAISAANGTFNQIKSIFPSYTTAQLWGMIGITPMIGVNDSPGETFSLSDAQQVMTFAQQNNIGLIAFWALDRDKQCSGSPSGPQDTCSGVSESAYGFSNIFKGITH